MREQGATRYLRSGFLTALIVFVSATSHVLGGGTLPALGIIVLTAALMMVPVTALAGRPLPIPALGATLLGGEVMLHSAFTTFSLAAAPASLGGPVCSGAVVSEHHGAPALDCGTALGAAESAEPAQGMMLLAHVLAAAVLAVGIAKGEAAVLLLAAWLAPLVTLLTPPVGVPAGRNLILYVSPEVPQRWRYLRVPLLRGPPVAAFPRLLPF